jgi:hypothetical protein
MKETIYYGKETPAILVGKNQINMGKFALEFRGWHSHTKDRATLRALKSLVKKGYLQQDRSLGMFRWIA